MSQNLISAEFSEADQQAALAAIQQIQSLSFLIGLSNSDVSGNVKLTHLCN